MFYIEKHPVFVALSLLLWVESKRRYLPIPGAVAMALMFAVLCVFKMADIYTTKTK